MFLLPAISDFLCSCLNGQLQAKELLNWNKEFLPLQLITQILVLSYGNITQKERTTAFQFLLSRSKDTILLVLMKFKALLEGFQALSLSMSCILRKQLYISLPFLYLSANGYTFKERLACLSTFAHPLSTTSLGGLIVAATPHFPSFHSKLLIQKRVFWKVEKERRSESESMQLNYMTGSIIIMGANQQRTGEVWITIQRNSKSANRELFDFSKERVVLNSNKVFSPSYLHYYEQQKTVTYSLLQDQQNQFAHLLSHDSSETQLCIHRVNTSISGRIWRLLQENEEVELEEGTFIKLGRIQLEIKELLFANHKKSVRSLIIQQEEEEPPHLIVPQPYFNHLGSSNFLKSSEVSRFSYSRMKDSDMLSRSPSDRILKNSIFTQRSSNQPFCRFCFDCSSSKRNPLFSVCRCAGSVKSIHFQCLKNWVISKTNKVETSHCVYYHYEPLTCEICKQTIRNEILHQGRVYKLFQAEKIHPPYARFEHFQESKVFVIVLRLEEAATINIGRGAENELSLNDQTISRSHSSLFYTSRKLFLKGKSSKYGTFVQLSKPVEFHAARPIQLLIQNNLISISRKPQQHGLFDQQCCRADNTYRLVVE